MGLSNIQITREAESWQFFAFIFAAFLTLSFGLIDEIQGVGFRILLKILAFVSIGYFTLFNAGCRNWLVGILHRFKQEQHG